MQRCKVLEFSRSLWDVDCKLTLIFLLTGRPCFFSVARACSLSLCKALIKASLCRMSRSLSLIVARACGQISII